MFKKIFLAVMISFSIFLFASPVKAEEKINNFVTNIKINEDSSLHVQEKIDYDFGDVERHGIFRNIPYEYKIDGKKYQISIDNIQVSDINNNAITFVVSNKSKQKDIKIGDANILLTGQKTYVIDYDVAGALNSFEDHDELFWNVTGNDWVVPIDNIEAKVELPDISPVINSQVTCYAGNYGSTNKCDFFELTHSASSTDEIVGANFATKNLPRSFGMTVVLGFEKGIISIPVPEPITEFPAWLVVLAVFFLFGGIPLLVLIIMILIWFFRGRDKKLHDPIIAQYDSPDNLPPGIVGTILDEHVDKEDLSSEIIYLAIAGYLKINRIETKKIFSKEVDYQLDKLKDADDSLKEYQKILLKAFFKSGDSVKLSKLKFTLFLSFKNASEEMTKFAADNGYFEKDPAKVKKVYNIVGIFFVALGMVSFPVFIFFSFINLAISGIIIILFGAIMSKRTLKGVKARNYILGLKEYIKVAEKERIKFHNAPEKNPQTFEKFLPYAMVFGLEKEWAKQFEGIYMEQPSWYSGADLATFSAVSFVNELSSFGSVANTSFAQNSGSSSGFSSGGFSGGGFGGGGGGSW